MLSNAITSIPYMHASIHPYKYPKSQIPNPKPQTPNPKPISFLLVHLHIRSAPWLTNLPISNCQFINLLSTTTLTQHPLNCNLIHAYMISIHSFLHTTNYPQRKMPSTC
ncbi:hypothetical protein EYC80_004418 [Monilinia laxa]|uniref:Uncharacterized protein n=1 Tax=Monilinia laxa TaxID=61186 RepID=A0A5N6KMT5_MONLA|nr:hypothetical protein EYC80_004418 [Monilinia laxa]